MNKLCKYLVIVFILQFAFVGHGEQAEQNKRSKDSYSIVIQRNIFSKNRSTSQTASYQPRPVDPNTIKKPDISFVYILRGVAIDSKKKTAFLENQSNGEFFQVYPDEQIDGMVIKEIRDDRVVFEKDGKKLDIFVGMDLSGQIASTQSYESGGSSASSSSGSTSTSASSGSTSPPSADEAEILRKMMERRNQQLGN